MSFRDHSDQELAVEWLQRSLRRGRLGHAYLFTGPDQSQLEWAASNLAKTLQCESPVRAQSGESACDACDQCPACRKVEEGAHPDVAWIRPESKSRIVTIDQMREVIRIAGLKPTQSPWKVAIITAADRMKEEASNAFLKTLEEPPGASVFVLLSTDPQRILETIQSRCLKLPFRGEGEGARDLSPAGWLQEFSRRAAQGSRGLLDRYRLLSVLLEELKTLREHIEESISQRSPLEQYEDAEPKLREKWEVELAAAIEAEYRHQRRRLLTALQWWFRDVWLGSLATEHEQLAYPDLAQDTSMIGKRLTMREAMANLDGLEQTQRFLSTNVQEALALEVGLLRLRV